MTEQELMQDFGRNLKFMLKCNGINQRELAEMIYMSEGSVSGYIKGNVMPSLRAFIDIVYALDCEPSDLIDFSEGID